MGNPILRRAYFMKFVASLTLTCFAYSFIIHQSVMAITALVQENTVARQLQSQPEQLVVPARYGRITSGHYSGNQRLVVYMQDLHCNPEVQKNIASILNLFDTKYGLNKIYLEGAPAGKLDTSLLGSIPNEKIRDKTIDGLVNKGLLGGGEYYALKFHQDKLYGLEEWAVYRDNLELYRKLSANKNVSKAAHKTLAAKADVLKAKYLARKLKRIEKVFASGRQESRYLRMERLGERVGQVVTGYPNLSRYIAMIKLNRTIKYSRLNVELAKYVKELQRTIPMNVYMSLTEKGNNPDSRDEYYRRLAGIAKQYSPGFERQYPAVGRFFAYVQLSYQINPIQLLEEERLFQDRVMSQYAERMLDKDLLLLSRLISDLNDYAELSMTPAQYRYFSEQRESFRILLRKYFERSEVQDALNLLADEDYSKFYAINVQRNEIFVNNIAPAQGAQISSLNTPDGYDGVVNHIGQFKTIDFVIAGGFHLDVAKLLKDKNVSYLMITPSVTLKADGSIYDQIMTGKIDYRKIITSALAPIADSLGIDAGAMGSVVAAIVVEAHGEKLSPSEIANEIAAWKDVAPENIRERMKVEFKDGRFDLYFRNSTEDPFSFVVGVKVTGGNTVEIFQAADGNPRVFTGEEVEAAKVNVFKVVAGIMKKLSASGQMLGFSRDEMINAVMENLPTAASSVPGNELRAFAVVLVERLLDKAEKKHPSVHNSRRLKVTSRQQASPSVRKIINELGSANGAIHELVRNKNIIIKKVAGDFFPGKSSGGDLGFASMEMQDNDVIFYVSGKFWDRILRGPPDLLRLLLKHELEEYVFIKNNPSKTYHDFHAESTNEYAPLFEMARKKIVRSASKQVQDASHSDLLDRLLGLVAEKLHVSPASLSGSLGQLINDMRGPPLDLVAEEKNIIEFIINAYTLGMLHNHMGHLDSELDDVSIPSSGKDPMVIRHLDSKLDKVSIPVKKEHRHGRKILFQIPSSTEKERLEVSIIGGGMNSYAAKIEGYIVKYVKNPDWTVSADIDWSHDYGMQNGKLHQIIWEYIRANEKWSDFIVPTKVVIARSAYDALDRDEKRKLGRFIKAGTVEIVTDSMYLHADNFPQGSGPADGNATVSVAIVQPVVRPLLGELERLLGSDDEQTKENGLKEAKGLIDKYVDYQKTMWGNGIFLVDATVSNVGVDDEGNIIAFDVEDAGIDPALGLPVRLYQLEDLEHTNRWRLWERDEEFDLGGKLGGYYEFVEKDNDNDNMFTIEGFKKIWEVRLPAPSAKQIRVLLRDPLVQAVLQALRGQFNEEAGDMSMEVTPLYDAVDEVLRAGIKTYKGEPVIIAANPTEDVQWESGKAWGSVSLPLEEWGIQNDPSIMYHFSDLLTGETFAKSGWDLHAEGLKFGLSGYRVHVLKISDVTISESSPLQQVLSSAMPKKYAKVFGHTSSVPVNIKKRFLASPRAQMLLQVLRKQYADMQGDRSLEVTSIESPDVIKAGIKMDGGHPVVVAMNASAETQPGGSNKAWGTISLPTEVLEVLNIKNDSVIKYHFHDLISGAVYERTGQELHEVGLTVGLGPYQTHVFRINEARRTVLQQGLARSLFPYLPVNVRELAGDIASDVGAPSWFAREQRKYPVLAGKSMLRVVPRVTDGVVRDLKKVRKTTGMPVVVVSVSQEEGPGDYVGAFAVPYQGGTLLMQAHRLLLKSGIDQLTISARFNDDIENIDPADLRPNAIHGLVSALTQGDLVSLLSGVSPWLVELDGVKMDEDTIRRMDELPVLFRAARLESYTDAPAKYEVSLALGEQTRSEIESNNVTRRGTQMVRAELAAVRDPDRSDIEESGTAGAVKGLIGKLKANAMSLQLDKLPLQVEANGHITKDAQLDDILGVPGISIVLDVPAGVNETIFAQEVEALLKAHKGLGIRLNLQNKAQIASVLRKLSEKVDGIAPAALIHVDVENDEQKQTVQNMARETGLTFHPIRAANGVAALPGEAVEITVDPADASSLQLVPAQLSDSLETGDVVFRIKGQMPFTGEGDLWLTLFSFARSRELPSARGEKVARAALKGLGWFDARAGKDDESLRRIAAALTGVLRTFENEGDYSVRMNVLLNAVRKEMGLDSREIELLEITINDIRRYIENEEHPARRAVRGEILAGFTRELLGETAVRLSPVDRARVEQSGNLDQLKTYLIQLALQEHGENMYVMLMKMKLGLPVNDNRADVMTPENLDDAIAVARTAVLAQQGAGDVHQLFQEFIAVRDSRDQSAAEVIGRIGNKAVAMMNRDNLDPESMAILLELYLTLRKDDFSKGFLESSIQSAQPALRAFELLLSAA